MAKSTIEQWDDGAQSKLDEAEHVTELLELGDAFFEMDSDWRIVRVNRRQEEYSGKPRTDTVGKTFSEVWPELWQADSLYWWEFDRCMREGTPVQFEEYFAERRIWTGVTAYPVSTGGIAVFFRDITARKRAENDIMQREARLRVMFDNMSEGVMLFGPSGEILIESPAALRIRGFAANEKKGGPDGPPVTWRSWDADLDPVSPDQWPLARVLRGEQFQNWILHAERIETGYTFTASYNGRPINDADGKLIYGFITIRDMTEQVRAEAALRQANESLILADRRKDDFLAMLSHELRNPLAPIRNSLYLLDRVDATGPQARRAKDTVNRQVAHLSRLVDDLLDVTRIARGKIQLQRGSTDIAALARRMAEDYLPLMLERGLTLAVVVSAPSILLHADEARLAQGLANLLSNAKKHTREGGSVTLVVERRADQVVIKVRDTGVGIEPDLLPAIFDPFVQAKQDLARTEGGLGLGLTVLKGIVELHGGSVSVTSTLGTGSEFTLTLPDAGTGPDPCTGAGARRTAPNYRVLVVDDNHDAADSFAELVRLMGHEVDVAYDGSSALATAIARPPAVVLCDLGLPGMDGYEVARALRKTLGARLRLVAVSGYTRPEDVKEALAAGFEAHVAKPPDFERVEQLLSAFAASM